MMATNAAATAAAATAAATAAAAGNFPTPKKIVPLPEMAKFFRDTIPDHNLHGIIAGRGYPVADNGNTVYTRCYRALSMLMNTLSAAKSGEKLKKIFDLLLSYSADGEAESAFASTFNMPGTWESPEGQDNFWALLALMLTSKRPGLAAYIVNTVVSILMSGALMGITLDVTVLGKFAYWDAECRKIFVTCLPELVRNLVHNSRAMVYLLRQQLTMITAVVEKAPDDNETSLKLLTVPLDEQAFVPSADNDDAAAAAAADASGTKEVYVLLDGKTVIDFLVHDPPALTLDGQLKPPPNPKRKATHAAHGHAVKRARTF